MKTYYPVGLDLEGRRVLLVGGGKVAEGKVDMLLECGADVRVVSPELTPRMRGQADRFTWEAREFEPSDVEGAWIVIAATDDRAVNAEVAKIARAAGRLVNAVDDVPNCDFIATSVVRRGDLQVSISTGGGSPAMARWVREGLEALIPEAYGPLLELLADIRAELKAAGRIPPYEAWKAAIDDGVVALLGEGRVDKARERLRASLLLLGEGQDEGVCDRALTPALSQRERGLVYLVGAGPGDPELITMKGRDCLAEADAVVYDHLVDERVLRLAKPGARLHFAGKEAGRHHLPQDEINALLIALADQGLTVVRLKGGDPFVFGRGGEEAAALGAAGVRFEVVPGVSSAIAAPAYAGIPVTHRGHAQAFTVVTGHCAEGNEVDWDSLARSGATLVVLMGMAHLDEIARRLIAAGRSPDEPAAVIQNASRPDQRTVTGTLENIAGRTAAAGLGSPAVIVVGAVAALHDRLAWFEEVALARP